MSIKDQVLALFNNETKVSFDDICYQIFKLQSTHNKVYNQYLEILGTDINSINSIEDIPLLPISCFKYNDVKTGKWDSNHFFLSSGTTLNRRSRHWVKDMDWYKAVSKEIFKYFFQMDDHMHICGLLPGYVDNPSSSLIHMVNSFIESFGATGSRIYNLQIDAMKNDLIKYDRSFLFAVTFAILDLVSQVKLEDIQPTVCFTGGMKGRGEELAFAEVVTLIKKAIPNATVCAEYGMTELFSQAYAKENGIYKEAPTMRVMPKEITDPLSNASNQRSAQLGIIDLANIDTVSFILTDDLVNKSFEGFEILGRLDYSDVRGCNLMYLEAN